jgi:hypothetical protein
MTDFLTPIDSYDFPETTEVMKWGDDHTEISFTKRNFHMLIDQHNILIDTINDLIATTEDLRMELNERN